MTRRSRLVLAGLAALAAAGAGAAQIGEPLGQAAPIPFTTVNVPCPPTAPDHTMPAAGGFTQLFWGGKVISAGWEPTRRMIFCCYEPNGFKNRPCSTQLYRQVDPSLQSCGTAPDGISLTCTTAPRPTGPARR